MNKLVSVFFACIVLTATGAAIAQDSFHGGKGKGQHHQQVPGGMPIIRHFVHGLKQLDLSEEQKESIHEVLQGLKTDAGPIMAETRADHEQLKELVMADVFDEDAVAELAAKEGELAADRIMLSSRALSQMLGYLTEEQRTALHEMAEQHMAERGQRHQRGKGKG